MSRPSTLFAALAVMMMMMAITIMAFAPPLPPSSWGRQQRAAASTTSCLHWGLQMPSPPLPQDLPDRLEQTMRRSPQQPPLVPASQLHTGMQSYVDRVAVVPATATAAAPAAAAASSLPFTTTTVHVSWEERRPPTAEEIAAKKRNFNMVFWGGGFVAPFLATIYYFGFKFWEK